jgi:hypothetical protein
MSGCEPKWLEAPPKRAAESPALGLSPLQFEAMLTTARLSPNRYDFALVTMLALLGLRNFGAEARSDRTPSPDSM